ncbi:DNA-binding transcriptional LysR family regulator [Devosia sp. UYZn731]|uniref:LysR family transcriptional regulator n=1 Tax=Devosia sp. UYZn731 TaxID=3156345 RepID=UPI003397E14F
MKNNVSADSLRIFLAVLEAGGFRVAAKRLGIAPSKVSTTVSQIETDLGVPLFLRSTRSVEATEHGRKLAEQIGPLLASVDLAVMEIASSTDRVRGRLKLNVPGAVVPDILPPILSAFHQKHPEVDVEVVVENDLVDIIAAGCDAGIRYGAQLARDMISIPIGPRTQRVSLAASPSYVAAHGQPKGPADLVDHQAIRFRLPGGSLMPWRLQRGEEEVRVEANPSLVISVNALDSALSYARAGIGIIGAFENWCEEDFRSGQLLPILQDWWKVLEGPRLYYPSRLAAAPLRAFIEMCRARETNDTPAG